MKLWPYVGVILSLCLICSGCGKPSADELFRKGEAATHRMDHYPEAERHLVDFLQYYPDDPRADIALQALARVLMNQRRNEAAIARYEELIQRLPNSRYCDHAQFMIGYIYDQEGKYDPARAAYQKVIQEYPTSELADDAHISIQNLGKAPELWLFPDSASVDTALGL